MSWPLPNDFNEAIQTPKIAFADPDLKTGEVVVGAHGLPLPRSGNFADVYQIRGADGRDRAVKCFTRPVVGLAERYAKVSGALARANFPFTVGFTYLVEGIRIAGKWYPVVKMEWVEGLQLNQVVRENAGRPQVLAALTQMWSKLSRRLRDGGIAHADLQHGNVLLVPGTRPGAYGLKLIDYDGMYIPALANQPSGEVGHPSYQHPTRSATRAYSPDVDRFSHLVVATALKGLEVGGSALWEQYDTGDNLLFTEADFQNPAGSKLLRQLWATDNPAVQAFAGRLAVACGKPSPQTPWLDQFAPEGEPIALDAAARRDAAAALGVSLPVPIPLPPEPGVAAVILSPLSLDSDLISARAPTSGRRPRYAQEKPTGNLLWIAGGAGIVALVLGGIVVAALSGGPKPAGTAEVEPEQKVPEPRPKPKEKEPVLVTPKPKDKDPVVAFPKRPRDAKPLPAMDVSVKWTADLGADFGAQRLVVGTDGKYVVALGTKGTSAILDAATGKLTAGALGRGVSFGFPPQPVGGGQFALTSLTSARPVPIYNPAAGRVATIIKPFEPATGGAGRTFVSPDLKYLAVSVVGKEQPTPFKLKDVAADKVILDFNCDRATAIFTADSARVLVSESTGRCRWFKLPAGELDAEWTNPQPNNGGGLGVTAASDDGSILLYEGRFIDQPAMAHLLDGSTGNRIRSLPGVFMSQSCQLSLDGRLVAYAARSTENEPRAIDAIDTATGARVAKLTAPAGTTRYFPALLPDSSGVVAAAFDGKIATVIRYDLVPKGSITAPPVTTTLANELAPKWTVVIDSNKKPLHPFVNTEFQWILLGNQFGVASVRDLKSGQVRAKFGSLPKNILEFFPLDRGRVGTLAQNGKEFEIWDLKSGRESRSIPVPEVAPKPVSGSMPTRGVQLSPSGRYVAVAWSNPGASPAAPDQPVQLVDAETGRTAFATEWKGGAVFFNGDSTRVLLAERHGRFRWFKLPLGTPDGGWTFDPPAAPMMHEVTGVSANGKVLAYRGPGKSGTRPVPAILDGATGAATRLEIAADPGAPPVLSEDGKILAVLLNAKGAWGVELLDATTGVPYARAVVGKESIAPSFALSTDGKSLVIHEPAAGKLTHYEVPAPGSRKTP